MLSIGILMRKDGWEVGAGKEEGGSEGGKGEGEGDGLRRRWGKFCLYDLINIYTILKAAYRVFFGMWGIFPNIS